MSVEHARAVRAAKAAALLELEQGAITLRQVLRTPPEALKGVDIWDLLLRCPSLGRRGARQACEDSATWPHTKLGEMLTNERRQLARALPRRVS